MEEDIQNYSSTVMFHETPCMLLLKIDYYGTVRTE